MTKILKVGVIGTGMIGQDHIRRLTNIIPNVVVTGVTDFDINRAKEAARLVPKAEIFETTNALIASANIDAILICSWGHSHEEAIMPVIAAGKPIMCEKPLAGTQEACLRIIEAEVKHGKRLIQVGYMRRYDSLYKNMKNIIESGIIGDPLIFHSIHRNQSVPSHYTGDMAISDTMVHDIDVSRWLLDSEVANIRVVGSKTNSNGGGLRDPLMALLQMKNNTLASIEVSVNIGYGYDIQGEISAESGAVSLGEPSKVIVKRNGRFESEVLSDWKLRFVDAFDVELANWVESTLKGVATGPSAWDGYAIQAVSDAGILSANNGEVVKLNMVDKPALYS